jgi:hypothetical protein
MKSIKSISCYFTPNIDFVVDFPETSELLHIDINQGVAIFLIEFIPNENTRKILTFRIFTTSISMGYVLDIPDNYVYVSTLVDYENQFKSNSSSAAGNSFTMIGLDKIKTTYIIYRQLTLDEKRDGKIDRLLKIN